MKTIFTLSLILIVHFIILPCRQAGAQTGPAIEWQNTIGGNEYDVLNSLQQTTDGGYILGGYSGSTISGDKTEDKVGNYDYWVIKLDDNGNIEWQNTIGGNKQDFLNSIQQTEDGGYILGGDSDSDISGDKTEANLGTESYDTEDYWIVKLDSMGDIEWENTIGGSHRDLLYSLKQTTDGGYILGGNSYSSISGDKTENNLGPSYTTDYWVVKLDDEGDIEWENTIGGDDLDQMKSIDQTADGGYIIGGSSVSDISGDKTENHFGGGANNRWDYWIIKLDAEGEIEWQNTIGGSSFEYAESIEQTTDGGYIVGGTSNSGISDDKTEARIGNDVDYWVVKLDNEGNIEWQNTVGGNFYDYMTSVDQTADGSYILGGFSDSDIFGDKTENSYGSETDYWVVKLDTEGNIEWENTIGGSEEDQLYSLQQTDDGGYILGGYSDSDISGDKTEASLGYRDYWVVKLYPEENEPCTTAPSGLYANSITANKAKLNWNADPDALKYKVQYRESTSAVWLSLNATTNYKKIPGLAANTTYKFRVRSQCSATLVSPWSNAATFTTLPLKEGELIAADEIEINIYPNPNSGNFNLEIPELNNENISIKILSMLGEEIYAEQINNSSLLQQIQLNDIENGIYIVELSTTDKIFSQQIIISK